MRAGTAVASFFPGGACPLFSRPTPKSGRDAKRAACQRRVKNEPQGIILGRCVWGIVCDAHAATESGCDSSRMAAGGEILDASLVSGFPPTPTLRSGLPIF